MANYNFVIDSSFKPFSMQEMLVPFQMYKDAFEKTEDAYMDLSQKADTFKYLSETLPEDSKARQIYEGYANGLAEQAEDLAQNGLSMANRRALTSYKRRYQGEIGRLSKADEALQKEIDRRTALSANDPTTLYATDNLSIDDFLDRKKPNDYSVSGDKLYQRGLQIGASDSSRIWSNPKVKDVNDYYQDFITTNGRSPEVLNAWRRDLMSIPELNDSLNATLKEFGVTDNLKGINLERAKESVINGIINGSTYKRNDAIQQNLGVLTADQQEKKREWGLEFDEKKREFDLGYDLSKQELQLKQNAATSGSGDSGDSNNVPSYDRPFSVSFNGTNNDVSEDDEKEGNYRRNGRQVHIEAVPYTINGKNTSRYLIKGNSGYVYGDISPVINKDKNGNIKGISYKTHIYSGNKDKERGKWFDQYFKQDFDTSFDEEYDTTNLSHIGDIVSRIITSGEGPDGYNNYDFYLEPDNASMTNDHGKVWVTPLGRNKGTVVNRGAY